MKYSEAHFTSQHYLDIKTRQEHYKSKTKQNKTKTNKQTNNNNKKTKQQQKELLDNIPDNKKCKNYLQNDTKLNSPAHISKCDALY